MKKPGLTPETHHRVGAQLHDIRNSLLHLVCEIGRSYPKNRIHVRHLDRALNSIDRVRSELENAFFREHPGEARIDAYYPGTPKKNELEPAERGTP